MEIPVFLFVLFFFFFFLSGHLIAYPILIEVKYMSVLCYYYCVTIYKQYVGENVLLYKEATQRAQNSLGRLFPPDSLLYD